MPRTQPENFSKSKSKGRSYKKNKPDPESSESDSDSDSNYETVSDTESYTSSSYVDTSSYSSESDKRRKPKKHNHDSSDKEISSLKNVISKLLASKKKKKVVEEEEEVKKSKSKKSKSKSKKSKKYESSDEESLVEDDSLIEYDDSDDDDSDDNSNNSSDDNSNNSSDNDSSNESEEDEVVESKDKNFKITLMIGGQPAGGGMKNRIPSNLSNEDDCNTDDEEIYMKENFEELELPGMPLSPLSESSKKLSNTSSDLVNPVSKKKAKEIKPDPLSEVVNIEEKYREIIELKRVLLDKLRAKPSKIIQRALKQCNHSIKKLIKHARSKNSNTYEELIDQADTQVFVDEIGYFKNKLSNKEQLRIMADLREINGYMYVEKPYRLSLLQSNMPPKFKAVALQRLHQLSLMEPGDPEYFKLKNWVDNFMRLPFGMHKDLSISIKDGIDKCSDFVVQAKEQLDKCVYGLEDAKMQIMQMVGQWIANPASIGTAIAIHGPPGSGKCFGINTPIMMFDGSIKKVQDIIAGDVLMGDDSTPRTVLDLGRGRDTMYKVIYNSGESYVVNSEHILCLYHLPSNEYIEMEIRDFAKLSNETRSKYVGYRTSINFTENYYKNVNVQVDSRIAGTRDERYTLLAELLGSERMKKIDGYGNVLAEYYALDRSDNAHIIAYVARSLGYRTYITREYPRDVELFLLKIHSKFDNKDERTDFDDSLAPIHVMEKIDIKHFGIDNYYGFEIDDNKRFILGDFTVVHNTSLVKDGISKILGREFAFIALGGCGDSSFLEGHSYTYEGSTWGKIAQIVMESKCMNPVIYFDELDKISDTPRGQEIIGVLTHLTDTTQNNQFHDKYFSEIELDLSKCMFIFSYNDENLVNPILRDRMYRIRTKGYDLKEKTIIARNYMLPKIREQVGFGPDDIVFSDEILGHIISNQAKGEEGVRNLKRSLEIIHTKLNLYRLVKTGTQMFAKEMGLNVSFPYTLTRKDVDTLVKVDNNGSSAMSMMYL
jgi:ATP-dependent Lon protease